jgi:hypothetical protein
MAADRFCFASDCPANSVARIFMETANDSPSPWGEGRVEGGRKLFEIRHPNSALETGKGNSFPEFIL